MIQKTRKSHSWVGTHLSGNRYQVVSMLGEGGMGTVFKARDHNLGTDVVVKTPQPALLQEPEFAARFVDETRSLVRLSHPHIVKITEVGSHDGIPFAVLQFLPGGSLRQRLMAGNSGGQRSLPLGTLHSWLEAISNALDYIHQQGFVHRDVKPDNILFDERNNAFLSDFGIAKALNDRSRHKHTILATGNGLVLGTSQYMAPELLRGKSYDGRADQYALAVTVYELVCGKYPYEGATPAALALRQASGPSPSLRSLMPELPEDFCKAVEKGLCLDPLGRFSSCRNFAEAVLKGVPETPLPELAARNMSDRHSTPGHFKTVAEQIHALCPKCRKRLKFPSTYQGRRVTCPNCKSKMIAPSATQVPVTQVQRVGAPLTGLCQPIQVPLDDPARGSGTSRITGEAPSASRSKPGKFLLVVGFLLSAGIIGSALVLMANFGRKDDPDHKKPGDIGLAQKEAKRKLEEEMERQRQEAMKKVKEEIERQKLEAERKAEEARKEFEEEIQRRKLEAKRKAEEEIERLRRMAEEEARRKKEEFEALKRFSFAEQAAFRGRIGDGETLGKGLLQITHPTGKYDFTEPAVISTSADQEKMTVRVTTHWRGGIFNSPYITTFSFSVSKITGYERLIVERDTALIRIAAENLQQADNFLRQEFRR